MKDVFIVELLLVNFFIVSNICWLWINA